MGGTAAPLAAHRAQTDAADGDVQRCSIELMDEPGDGYLLLLIDRKEGINGNAAAVAFQERHHPTDEALDMALLLPHTQIPREADDDGLVLEYGTGVPVARALDAKGRSHAEGTIPRFPIASTSRRGSQRLLDRSIAGLPVSDRRMVARIFPSPYAARIFCR